VGVADYMADYTAIISTPNIHQALDEERGRDFGFLKKFRRWLQDGKESGRQVRGFLGMEL
jgi:hypothetical protein